MIKSRIPRLPHDKATEISPQLSMGNSAMKSLLHRIISQCENYTHIKALIKLSLQGLAKHTAYYNGFLKYYHLQFEEIAVMVSSLLVGQCCNDKELKESGLVNVTLEIFWSANPGYCDRVLSDRHCADYCRFLCRRICIACLL